MLWTLLNVGIVIWLNTGDDINLFCLVQVLIKIVCLILHVCAPRKIYHRHIHTLIIVVFFIVIVFAFSSVFLFVSLVWRHQVKTNKLARVAIVIL